MTGLRKISGFLSIAAMSLLTLVLFTMVNASVEDSEKRRPVTVEKEAPKFPKKKVLAVSLPPPPREVTALVKTMKPAAINKPPIAIKITPLRSSPAKSPVKMIEGEIEKAAKTGGPATEKNGRALLRLLEFGKGPSIEIAWPAAANDRARLFGIFKNCFGMKTALLDARNRLYISDGTAGQPWRPNLDKFSAFMRRPSGRLSSEEDRELKKIRATHAMIAGSPVRLFPRGVDAVLLAGLKRLVEKEYDGDAAITARYLLVEGSVSVTHIRINGHEKIGKVILPPVRRCAM